MRPPGPDPALVGHYERLRRRALSGVSAAAARAGYGLLVQRGMLAWMRTWAACTPPEEPAPVAPPVVASTPNGALLAAGGEAEVVELLTALILSSHANRPRQPIPGEAR